MSNEQKPGDPADRVIDAKADGAFGGAHSHRAGYGGIEFEGQTYTKLEWVERTARIGGTLAAGEGRMLLAENDRLRARCRQIDDEAYDYAEQIEQLKAAAKDSADNYADARAEIDRLRERLAAVEAENGLACRLVAKMHLAATGETTGPTLGVVEDVLALRQRADRAERILAALREPSENVSKAVWSTWGLWDSQNHFAATLHALVRAAVIAAEQEVDHA